MIVLYCNLVRAMNVFGREYMLKTFLKTLKVERLGGILTKVSYPNNWLSGRRD